MVCADGSDPKEVHRWQRQQAAETELTTAEDAVKAGIKVWKLASFYCSARFVVVFGLSNLGHRSQLLGELDLSPNGYCASLNTVSTPGKLDMQQV